ncbi:hypothetical protein HHE06_02830 [Helicobacter heilmannii]|uniref:hypothetical protein n=1 Tax=Helicobacter heilmannii TaxID=35817 RepID=UPI0006A1BEF2|nr:hypothetical protein [Helicobacter heilmannii]CRF50456.1 hypothetical protein HHE06_02830 [Helicobacter heilmannii]
MTSLAWQNALSFHVFLMALGPVLFLLNLAFLWLAKNYASLNKTLYFIMPMVFMWVAMAFFSGVFLWAMQRFHFSWKVGLMGLVLTVVCGGEIWRVRKLKIARTKEAFMLSYIQWCKGLYGLNLLLCLALFL